MRKPCLLMAILSKNIEPFPLSLLGKVLGPEPSHYLFQLFSTSLPTTLQILRVEITNPQVGIESEQHGWREMKLVMSDVCVCLRLWALV